MRRKKRGRIARKYVAFIKKKRQLQNYVNHQLGKRLNPSIARMGKRITNKTNNRVQIKSPFTQRGGLYFPKKYTQYRYEP